MKISFVTVLVLVVVLESGANRDEDDDEDEYDTDFCLLSPDSCLLPGAEMYKYRACLADHQPQLSTTWLPSGGIGHEFMAWLPQGVMGPKVDGFLSEQEAHVLEADADHIRLQIGQRRWLRWGSYGEDFPLELTLQLNRDTACARSLTHVLVELRPLVDVPEEVLQHRCCEIFRSLRYCLLAQELEVV